jgi:hypothetical protein
MRQKCSDDYDKDNSVTTIKAKLSELRMSVAHAWNSSIATTLDLLGVNPSRKSRQTLLTHEQVMNLLLSSTVEDPNLEKCSLPKRPPYVFCLAARIANEHNVFLAHSK